MPSWVGIPQDLVSSSSRLQETDSIHLLQEFGEDVSAAMSAGAAKASSIFQSSLSSLKIGALASTLKRSAVKEPAAGKSIYLSFMVASYSLFG